jgi:TolB protein
MKIIVTGVFVLIAFAVCARAQMFHQDISWSPDGKYLAFTGMHDYDKATDSFKTDIYVIRVDGSDLRKISSDERNEFYTSWAKGRIAFGVNADKKQSDIFTANPDGSDLRQITHGNGRTVTPAISHDGKLVAYALVRDGAKHQIYVMNADGSNIKPLTDDPAIACLNPQWSHDGKRIVYYAEKGDGKDQVWVMNSDGSNKTLLTAGVGHNIFPGWSPDGKKIIFSSSKRDSDSSGSFVDGSFHYTMNPDGSGLQKLGNIKSFFARFSPDGKKIAYVSGRFPSTSIYIANADGSGAMAITK